MAGRGAPNKRDLKYFPKMVSFYEDDKIFDLLEAFGPLGVTVYDVILTIVYKRGYYAEMSADKLARMIVRTIGTRWCKKEAVVQVIDFCADIGLLYDALLSQGIITSAGIQKRYFDIAITQLKRRLYDDRYWLIGKNDYDGSVLNVPKNGFNAEENQLNSAINTISSEEIPIEIKGNKKEINKRECKRESGASAPVHTHKERAVKHFIPPTGEQVEAYCREKGYDVDAEYFVKHYTSNGWMVGDNPMEDWKARIDLWESQDKKRAKEGAKQGRSAEKKNRFHNFDQVGYDYEKILEETSGD